MNKITSWAETVRAGIYASRHKLATGAVGVLLLVLAYHVVFGTNGLVAYQQKRKESLQLQQQIESMKRQNDLVEQQIKALKYDPQAIEKEARERLHYARPGEVIYTVPAPRPTTPSADRK